jgi:hypothetical protein
MTKQDEHDGGNRRTGLQVNSATVLSDRAVGLLAVAVANAYSIQPLLVEVGGVLSISSGLVGILPGLSQIGLACGLAFLLPLGDIILARRLLLTVIPMQIAALVLFAADISATIVDISTRTILYGLDAGIRTRLNAVYQAAMFSGTR